LFFTIFQARDTIPAIEAEITTHYQPKNHNEISIKTEQTAEVFAEDDLNEEMDEIPYDSDDDKFDPLPGISLNKRKIVIVDDDNDNNETNEPTKKKKNWNRPSRSKTNKVPLEDIEVQCYYCSEMMLKSVVKEHMMTSHGRYIVKMFGEKRQFQCPACHAALVKDITETINHCCFTDRPQKIRGMKSDGSNIHQCDQCMKTFKSVKGLEVHMKTSHSDERPFACDKCEFRAKQSVILRRHIERIHKKLANHMCNQCGENFYSSYELKLHAEKSSKSCGGLHITQELEYNIQLCDKCERTFESLKALRLHRTMIHKITEKPTFCCDKCDKVLTTNVYLKRHMKAEHPTDEQIASVVCNCEKCPLKFQYSIDLNRHLSTCLNNQDHHDQKSTTFKCENCETNNWYSHISLRKHYAEVHRKIWDICDICGIVLKRSSVKSHKQVVHSGVKDFTCEQCGKTFSQKNGLQSHISGVHGQNIAGKYQFQCDKCDYTTVAEHKLKKHNEATHIREVKYKCDMCNYFGYRKHGLENHINAVHKKLVRHICDHCEMGFYDRRDKINHIQKQHSNK
jgi:hypothetical protein